MKVNRKLMKKVRDACKTDEDRQYVRELVELARDPYCEKYIGPMLSAYRDNSDKTRKIIDLAREDSSVERQETRDLIAKKRLFVPSLFSLGLALGTLVSADAIVSLNNLYSRLIGVGVGAGVFFGIGGYIFYSCERARKLDCLYDNLTDNHARRNISNKNSASSLEAI